MRIKQINIRLTEEEFLEIKKLAKKQNLTITNLFLDSVFNKIPIETKRTFFKAINLDDFNYSKIGNNINQIAKYVNSSAELSRENSSELLKLMRELLEKKNANDELFREIYKYLSK